ncbi:hypothetical protein [Streptomyces sp. NPDC093261]|uniref:hypothetical protein n=1 Tax=Streptomyces sp. NPDC093261 TaxID=3366037 RepID=UPI0037FA2FE1
MRKAVKAPTWRTVLRHVILALVFAGCTAGFFSRGAAIWWQVYLGVFCGAWALVELGLLLDLARGKYGQ